MSEAKRKATKPGQEEKPEVFAISRENGKWTLSRREFLAAAAGASAMAAGLAGCKSGGQGGVGKAHSKTITALEISPDAKSLYSSGGNEIKRWALPYGALEKGAKYDLDVADFEIMPGSKMLASVGSDGLTVRELPDFKGDGEPASSATAMLRVGASPDGKLLACVTDNNIQLRSASSLDVITTIDNAAKCVIFDRRSRLLIAGGKDGRVRVWSVDQLTSSTGQDAAQGSSEPRTLEGHADSVVSLAVTPDNTTLATGGSVGTIRLWSLPDGAPVNTINAGAGGALALEVSPDGKLLISGSGDNMIRLWSLRDVKLRKTLKGHTDDVTALEISPDGRYLASGSADGTIRCWELPSGKYMGALLDLSVNYDTIKGVQYKTHTVTGQEITYTLPCGSPIPPGATCVCNCVPGSIASPRSTPRTYTYTYTYCTCNQVHYWHPN
ncbi:MAG: WD40 repeat domain-containing protein [Armatimonadota bacterium]|nr:WD40 repeat domain-containing protein [Armatimonadota bacterium]